MLQIRSATLYSALSIVERRVDFVMKLICMLQKLYTYIICYLIIHLKLFTSLACSASSGSAFHANHSGIGEVPFEKLSVGFWNTFVYVAASSFILVDLTNWCKVACQFRLIKGQTDQRQNFLKLRDLPFLTF